MLFKDNADKLRTVMSGQRDGECRSLRPLTCGQRGTPATCRRQRLRWREKVTTLRGDTGVWSVQHYSVKKLVEIHSSHFPLIVKVTRACHDNAASEPSINQVLQIHDSARQTRLEAVDSLGRNLSIPADFPVDVTPTDGHRAGEYMTLTEASVILPVKVEVLRTTSDVDGTTKRVRTGQVLLLRSLREDVFLRVNAINRGWIDQSEVVTIPSWLGTEFAVAEGMRGATSHEWTDYKNMFSRSVRHINFDLVQGPPQIFILGEPRSMDDFSTLPCDDLARQPQLTTEEQEEAEMTTRKDCKTGDTLWLQRDVGASCSRA